MNEYELGESLNEAYREQARAQAQLSALESLLRVRMSREALQRYGNLKAAYPEKSAQLIAVLANLSRSGRIEGTISDGLLKAILHEMSAGKRETRILRR